MLRTPRLHARLGGLMYLVIIAAGGFGYLTGSARIVAGDPVATAHNILTSEPLWRLGFATLLVMLVCDVGVAVVFYRLFEPVSRSLALLGFAFRLVQTAILGVVMLARFAPLLLLRDTGPAVGIGTDQRQALAYLSLQLFERGFNVALVFFGFDCLAIGWLIFRSTFLPRALGIALIAAGACYLINSFADFLFPALALPFYFLVPSYAAELVLCLWLIVMGLNAEHWRVRAGLVPAKSMTGNSTSTSM